MIKYFFYIYIPLLSPLMASSSLNDFFIAEKDSEALEMLEKSQKETWDLSPRALLRADKKTDMGTVSDLYQSPRSQEILTYGVRNLGSSPWLAYRAFFVTAYAGDPRAMLFMADYAQKKEENILDCLRWTLMAYHGNFMGNRRPEVHEKTVKLLKGILDNPRQKVFSSFSTHKMEKLHAFYMNHLKNFFHKKGQAYALKEDFLLLYSLFLNADLPPFFHEALQAEKNQFFLKRQAPEKEILLKHLQDVFCNPIDHVGDKDGFLYAFMKLAKHFMDATEMTSKYYATLLGMWLHSMSETGLYGNPEAFYRDFIKGCPGAHPLLLRDAMPISCHNPIAKEIFIEVNILSQLNVLNNDHSVYKFHPNFLKHLKKVQKDLYNGQDTIAPHHQLLFFKGALKILGEIQTPSARLKEGYILRLYHSVFKGNLEKSWEAYMASKSIIGYRLASNFYTHEFYMGKKDLRKALDLLEKAEKMLLDSCKEIGLHTPHIQGEYLVAYLLKGEDILTEIYQDVLKTVLTYEGPILDLFSRAAAFLEKRPEQQNLFLLFVFYNHRKELERTAYYFNKYFERNERLEDKICFQLIKHDTGKTTKEELWTFFDTLVSQDLTDEESCYLGRFFYLYEHPNIALRNALFERVKASTTICPLEKYYFLSLACFYRQEFQEAKKYISIYHTCAKSLLSVNEFFIHELQTMTEDILKEEMALAHDSQEKSDSLPCHDKDTFQCHKKTALKSKEPEDLKDKHRRKEKRLQKKYEAYKRKLKKMILENTSMGFSTSSKKTPKKMPLCFINMNVQEAYDQEYKKHEKLYEIMDDIKKCPWGTFGAGKAEVLKHPFKGHTGCISRRLNQHDRLIYKIHDETILVLQVGGHYD